jgi:uncharacterized protein (TIGR00730 family)
MPIRRICVFTGSNSGVRLEYTEAARSLGKLLADRRLGLVYGGASVGLMATVANAVLQHGGRVTGVIPEALVARDVAHTGLSDLRVVASMHERKALMVELSSGFIALPGGLGTLDELFEILTWAQLGIHQKPCGLLNIAGYYNHMVRFLDHAVEEQFVKGAHRSMLHIESDAETLLARFDRYSPPVEGKWIGRGT